MKSASLLFLFLFSVSLLSASEEYTETIWSAEALEPSSVFNGSVNVITGQYMEHAADIHVRGVERLTAIRGICGGANARTNGKVIGWTMGQPSLTTYGKGESKGRRLSDRDILVCDLNGSRVLFKPFSGEPAAWNPSVGKGLCNTGWGEISGKTNLINRIITFAGENRYQLKLGSGQEQLYACWSDVRDKDVPRRDQLAYYLTSANQPNGRRLELEWGGEWLLKRVIAVNGAGTQFLGWLQYDYSWRDQSKDRFTPDISDLLRTGRVIASREVNGKRLIEVAPIPGGRVVPRPLEPPCDGYAIESSDGQRVEYVLGPYGRLDKVQVRGQPKICFQYHLGSLHRYRSDSVHRVEARWLPEGRYLENIYYNAKENQLSDRKIYLEWRNFNSARVDHPAVGRVCEQYGPVGPGGTRGVIATYEYHFCFDRHRNPEEVAGWTEVWDANRDRATFHYSAEKRLTKIDRHERSDRKISCDYYTYGTERPHFGNLLGKVVCDGEERPLAAMTLEYDARGNVIAERLWGELTGRNQVALQMGRDSLPIANGVEYCEKRSIYPQEEDNRLLIKIDGNQRTEWSYWGKSDLVRSRLLCDGDQIFERHFYQYDENGILIEYSWDSGTSREEGDLTGVTWRRMRRVTPVESGNAIGLPRRVEEWYWDGESHLLGAVEYTYNRRNFITAETVFDADNEARYTLYTEYDEGGRPLLRRDPLGHETQYRYDINANLISELGPRPGCETVHTYDRANRRIATQRIGPNGESQTTRYKHDSRGNCIETQDYLGNCVESEFGALGRLKCQRFPTVEGGGRPERRFSYNALSQRVSEVNELGEAIERRYNVRGQPIEERFPDGTTATYEYTPYGLPVRSVSREGVVTWGSYDRLGHLLTLTVQSPDGSLVREISFRYDGDRVIFTRDGEGNERHYRYDGAGRLIAESCGESWIGYRYDSLGRLCRKIISFGYIAGDHREEWTDYDLLGRVIEERVADSLGTILRRVRYAYDEVGNRTEVVTFDEKGSPQVERTKYDAFNRPVEVVDQLGNKTVTEYTQTTNRLGQQVAQTVVTNPLGERTITTLDAMGRVARIETLDSFGVIVSDVERSYDLAGQLVAERTAVLPQFQEGHHTVQWVRGPMGRAERVIEGESRTIQYNYNRQGQVTSKIAPSGEVTVYQYDGLNRLIDESGSGYRYHFEYDHNDNLIRATDEEGRETVRIFDQHNWLLSEKQSSGLTIGYRRDRVGRPLECLLPDGSALVRNYDAADLISVGRKSTTGELLYDHAYTARDLSGRILRERLVGNVGEVVRVWNGRGGLIASEGAGLSERLKYDALGRVVVRNCERYRYDGLSQLIEDDRARYFFNSLGNRHSVNRINELIEKSYSHDRNGCLTLSPGRACRFDGRGRLIEIVSEGVTYRYVYDSFDRRIEERRGDEVIHYLYNGEVEVAAFHSGEMVELRLLGEGIGSDVGAIIAVELNGAPYAVRSDYRGSVAVLLDLSGEVVEQYTYSAFGKGGEGLCPWRFSSKRVDPTGLVYFGYRYYDPSLGRWMSPDPLGFSAGSNLYAYCGNDPLNRIDSRGLWYGFVTHRGLFPMTYESSVSRSLAGLTDYLAGPLDRPYSEFNPISYLDGFEEGAAQRSSLFSLSDIRSNPALPEFGGGALMWVNGMVTDFKTAVGHSEYLSGLAGGCNVHGVWNATHGIARDGKEAVLQLYCYCGTDPVHRVHEVWDDFFSRSEPNQLMFVICQSQGVIIIRNSLLDYDRERRKRIMVLAVAPASYIDEEICGQILHLVSRWDPITWVDFMGRIRCTESIIYVERHPTAPRVCDHAFRSASYQDYIEGWLKSWIVSELR